MSQTPRIPAYDEHDRRLVANVRPPDWKNPTPRGRYDLVVIGAGAGGLISALVASVLGARVALVERHLLGGDCLNVGCVPSKALIRAGALVHDARSSAALGVSVSELPPDFGAAMEHVRRVRAHISADDAARRYTEEFGVDVYFGHARFVGQRGVEVEGTRLEYLRAIIASGARAAAPPIPGLAEAGYLDNESVFTLTERPERVAVLGAGPIGCELAQAFRRLGSRVVLLERMDQVLGREDPDAAMIVQGVLAREGIVLWLGADIQRVEAHGAEKWLHVARKGEAPTVVKVDRILVGAGRAANVEDMGLETVGVEHDRSGVRVNDFLQTSHPDISAVGDVCMSWKFTHAADAAAKIAVQNALFALGPFGRRRVSSLVMPWCTYTHPEIAHVGLYESDAKQRGIEIDTYQVPLEKANRAVTDGQEEGLVKVHVKKGTDRIVGATIVAPQAGELITQLTLAIQHGIGLSAFGSVIYPYPTVGEAIKATASAYSKTRLTSFTRGVLGFFLRLHR